jgi:hypothetical protein
MRGFFNPPVMSRFALSFRLLCVSGFGAVATPDTLLAQRERLIVRLESFAPTTAELPLGRRSGDDVDQRSLQLSLANRIIRDKGNTMFLVGAQYRETRAALPALQTVGGRPAPALESRLRVATADLWMLRTLNATYTVIAVARPGLYGDLDAIGDQWRLEGAVFVDRIMSPKATVGLGMSYASNFGRVLAVPVVHVVARPKRRLLFDALLPSRADLWWMPRKGLDLGIGTSLTGAQYGLSNAAAQPLQATALQLANATVGPQLRWTPRGKWQLTADAGTTVLRRLRYARGAATLAEMTPDNVFFGRLGAQWLF